METAKIKLPSGFYDMDIERGRIVGLQHMNVCDWIETCGGIPLLKMWREAEAFATDENKNRISAILRKFKASKWYFSILGLQTATKIL